MKKVIIGVATALVTVIMCMVIAGCTTKVKGKTYVYDSYSIEYTDDASDAVKTICDAAVSTFALGLKDATIEFKDDGTAVMGGITYDYEQDGKNVVIKKGDVEIGKYTVSGKNIKATLSSENAGLSNIAGLKSLTVSYKQK